MAQNLAKIYSKKTSERLHSDKIFGLITNKNYEFSGGDTVYLYSVDTFPMQTYRRSGDNRYGTSNELGNTKQTWALEQESSFSGTVDKLNNDQTMGIMTPASILARQVREEVVPEMNTYCLSVIGTAGATYNRDDVVTDAVTTSSNAYTNLGAMLADIRNNHGKTSGLVLIMTPAYYNMLFQSGYVLASNMAMGERKSGDLGTVLGCSVIVHGDDEMPANTDLIITHKEVTTFADILTDYHTYQDPPNVSGVLIQGRVAYDFFVDINKIYDVAIHKTA